MKLITAVALSCLFTTAASAQPTIRPIGLSIGSPMIEDMDFDFKPNGVNAGTSVHLLISGLDQPIVLLNDDNSTLDKATDSTGKDLLQERQKENNGFMFSSSSSIGPFPHISEDGKQLIVELSTPQAPAKGATSIHLEGTLSVTVASGIKTVRAENVASAPGKVQLGENSVEVLGYGPSDWEEGKFKLELKLASDLLDAISAWKVTAPDGEELSDGPYSTMTMMNTAQVELTLEKKTDTFTIELALYDGIEQVAVPVSVDVGMGIE